MENQEREVCLSVMTKVIYLGVGKTEVFSEEVSKRMKDIELKLISELMRNSRRTDKDLAKAIGVSTQAAYKTRKKLEKEGYFSEYTAIPNFSKAGYHLFALTFTSFKKDLSGKDREEARKYAAKQAPIASLNAVLIERGIGMDHDAVLASFHEDYSSYTNFTRGLKSNPYLDSSKLESFLVNLDDDVRYRPFTLSTLAQHMLTQDAEKKP
jgi:DNA-binding Lrp family transcriptional regulator